MSGRTSRRRERALLAVLAVAGVSAIGATSAAPSATAAPRWHEGPILQSLVYNCSIVGQPPYLEPGVGTYLSYYADNDAYQPVVGRRFYVSVTATALGNACPNGIQYAQPELRLPAGMTLDAGGDVACYYDGRPFQPCPQDVSGSLTRFSYPAPPGVGLSAFWPLAQGHSFEFVFPVTVSAPGAFTVRASVQIVDGSTGPTLEPEVGLWAYSHRYSVSHPTPSTTTEPTMPGGQTPRFGLLSRGRVTTNGVPGTAYIDLGTSATSFPYRASVALDRTHTYWDLSTDWNEAGFPGLRPGQRYYWRMGFRGTGDSAVTWGRTQQFVAPLARSCRGKAVTVALSLGERPTARDDVVLGTAGGESVRPGGGHDTVCALNGNDVIDGGAGDDLVDGGAGNDTVAYATASGRVRVDLGTTGAQRTGGAGTDRILAAERVVGSRFGDELLGNGYANVLQGGPGSDVLRGRGGDDTLDGASGNDRLYGEGGRDRLLGGTGRDAGYGGPGRDSGSSLERRSSVP